MYTDTLTEASEAGSSLDVVVGSFDVSDESLLRSEGNFGQPTSPGRAGHHFSPFVVKSYHSGLLESQSFTTV